VRHIFQGHSLDLYYAFKHNKTIRDRFDAVAPDPPPPCPCCGGKSVYLSYNYPEVPSAFFSDAGSKLYAYLAHRTEYLGGCFVNPEKFRCQQCGHRWPMEYPGEMRDLFA
jgi:hypothetical protein